MSEKVICRFRLWCKLLWAALTSRSNQHFYDRIAPVYDLIFTGHAVHAKTISEELVRLFGKNKQCVRLLDLGCGTGMLSTMLANKMFRVYGLDISFDSLKVLQQKQASLPLIRADAEHIPLADNSLNAVVCLGVWRHFPDFEKVLYESARVLNREGVLIIGYFPPAIGGALHLRCIGDGKQYLLPLYQFIIRKLGYVDRADEMLEEETLELAGNMFSQIGKIISGGQWHLLMARFPKKV